MKESKNVRKGVFADLGCAVIDRVDVSITGDIRQRPWKHLVESSNKPCLGKRSFYGRVSLGVLSPTENPYQVQYSKATRLPLVPNAMLRLDSERSPLSVAEILLAIRSLTDSPDCARVSYVEVAFDLFGRFDELRHAIVSTATRRRRLYHNKENGLRALYLGGRASERYVCLYEKPPNVAAGVVRVEIRIDRRGLRRLGIVHPEDLLLLRNVDFTRLVSFSTLRVPVSVEERWRRNAFRYLGERIPMDVLARDFTECFPRSAFLRRTSDDRLIRKMQNRMVC